MRRHRERGSVTIVVMGLAVLAMVLMLGAARLGSAVISKARAETAADAAALAAADALALGKSSTDAIRAARETAAANDARLVSCECRDRTARVEIVLQVAPVRAHARADVDAGAGVVSEP